MSNYTKTTDFAAKDSLPTGNASKRVRGSEVDAEFEAIETAVATKLDQYSSASAQTALDDDADVVSIYDDSAGSYKKITVANLKNTFIQFASGTYTGDGSTSQAITGVGFAPKYVKIVNRETVNASTVGVFETWAEVMDDNAAGGAIKHTGSGGHDFSTNAIISLDSDGFTVDDGGSDANPNKNGDVYNYFCIG